jgi:hypothetical protein
MKRLLLFLILGLPCSALADAILPGTGVCNGTNDAGTTVTIDTTGGATAVKIGVSYATGSTISVTNPSNGDTATAGTARVGALVTVQIYTILNPTSNASYTVSVSGTSIFASLCARPYKFSAIVNLVDQTSGAVNGFDVMLQPGSVTPGSKNEMIFSVIGFSGSVSGVGIDSMMSTPVFKNFSALNYYGIAISDNVQTSIVPINPTWSWMNVVESDVSLDTNRNGQSVVPVIRTYTQLRKNQ